MMAAEMGEREINHIMCFLETKIGTKTNSLSAVGDSYYIYSLFGGGGFAPLPFLEYWRFCMKKFFRHITKVIIFSFVMCLFLPLQAHADVVSSTSLCQCNVYDSGSSYMQQRFFGIHYDSSTSPVILTYSNGDSIYYYAALVNTRLGLEVLQKSFAGKSSDGSDLTDTNQDITWTPDHVENAIGNYCYYTYISHETVGSKYLPYSFDVPVIEFSSLQELQDHVASGDLTDDIPIDTDTDGYTLDKSLGLVKNARWKHLESKDKYNQVLQDAMNKGTGTGDPGNAFYSDIYTRYAEFVQDKCSFATTSTTGVKIGGRYQLQYASRVGFTFAYNLPDLLEHTDFTKQYYKRFGSPKPYPVVNGTNFDANQNIQSLFLQAYQWNDSLPSVGNLRRSLIFKETKYWIDVRIIDTKTKTYGAWYAMDMINNTAKEVVTDDGDIDSDVSSEDDAGNYTKEEGEGDTFQDAEDNAKEVDHSTHYDQKWYDDIKDNTKKSAPAFKNLLSMITGIPKMIATLFSWLPSWVLELVSAFFAIIIVLALLRFVLGS